MLKDVLDILEILDSPAADGQAMVQCFAEAAPDLTVDISRVEGDEGHTDFFRLLVPGQRGKQRGGSAPTLGIIGRHGGSGARPQKIGYVSDGDGAAAALAAGLKLARMHAKGDRLHGDVIITTHICPHAPTTPHEPVEFMGSPVDMATKNHYEVDEAMDAILSIDTTKGNRIVNHRGIAISPTVTQGWIIPVSKNLVSIQERVTGELAHILPLSMGDITPYGNEIPHINSIMQPATATHAPVVGVAITAISAVAGSATGASHEVDIALAARFAVEVAKDFSLGRAQFYDKHQFDRLVALYGQMTHLQTLGKTKA